MRARLIPSQVFENNVDGGYRSFTITRQVWKELMNSKAMFGSTKQVYLKTYCPSIFKMLPNVDKRS